MKIIIICMTCLIAITASICAETPNTPSVNVTGWVQKPGTYALQSDESIWSILERAKPARVWNHTVWLTRKDEDADIRILYQYRSRNPEKEKKFWSAILLQQGDVVYFGETAD
jgi:protein involved in polysaccharide export with SLBB domain